MRLYLALEATVVAGAAMFVIVFVFAIVAMVFIGMWLLGRAGSNSSRGF